MGESDVNHENVAGLAAQLRLERRKLKLVLAIDRVRDELPEPSAMLTGIATVLADHFQAELCLIGLLHRETGELELKAIVDRGKEAGWFEPLLTRELATRIAEARGVVLCRGADVLPPPALARLPGELYIAALPVIFRAHKRLGIVLLARAALPFGEDDAALLKIAESQIDSAVVQGYTWHELRQRNKELETVYKIDRIRDRQLPFDEMLHLVLHEVRSAIGAEMSYILLYNHLKRRLELRASTHDDLYRLPSFGEVVERVANEALQTGQLLCYNLDAPAAGTPRTIMCIPLILNDEIIGVLGVANRYGSRGFMEDERRLLHAIGSQIDTAIFEGLERRRLRQLLGRSVDPQVLQRLLDNPDVEFLRGERTVLSVLYSDLRGSTSLAERTRPDLLVDFINDCLARMTEIILAHHGTLDKFTGDGAMALFGAPFPQEDHALRAVRVGLEMQAAHREIMDHWRERGIEPASLGVGIATGELTVGEMGCPQRTDYTVIGQAANLGARLCSVAQPGQVLVCQETYERIKGQVEAMPVVGLQLKGLSGEVTAYSILRLATSTTGSVL
ncbi:MAG: GAF domain-containing protein [Anaerolineae bacterium]|nr:GAF domain-containing protein [Anaerolineae bacterium]